MREAANMYGLVSLIDRSGGSPLEGRMIARMRLILASSALLIIFIDPAEPDRYVALTYTTLVLYTLYSAALYLFARYFEAIRRWAHWLDVGWFTALVALSSGTNSIFFFGFFFSILVASFRWGFASGLRVAVISAAIFTTVGLATGLKEPGFELNRFLLRPIYLLVLGYMIAYWGGSEISFRGRLALLKEISRLSNPRFGLGRTIGAAMERLRAFYDADACLLVLADQATAGYSLRRADRRDPEAAMRAGPIAAELARQLLAPPDGQAIVYCGGWRGWRRGAGYFAYDPATAKRSTEGRAMGEALATLLDAESFVSAPVRYRNEAVGRLYLIARRGFDQSDVDFLLQVFEHITPVVDNIRLVDRLASNAAEEERRRVARDLHDSVIQPYIGLQIGLKAICQKLDRGDADVSGDLKQLLELTESGIADLRQYVSGLRDASQQKDTLAAAVGRFAAKFSDATGIAVRVEAEADLRVHGRLAAELFRMVTEGLSNIRRHTQSTNAVIRLARREGRLVLKIENDNPETYAFQPFTPRSITERAEDLGGQARVEQDQGSGHTVVTVEIPL
jgi:signal transduction histidine kinase